MTALNQDRNQQHQPLNQQHHYDSTLTLSLPVSMAPLTTFAESTLTLANPFLEMLSSTIKSLIVTNNGISAGGANKAYCLQVKKHHLKLLERRQSMLQYEWQFESKALYINGQLNGLPERHTEFTQKLVKIVQDLNSKKAQLFKQVKAS